MSKKPCPVSEWLPRLDSRFRDLIQAPSTQSIEEARRLVTIAGGEILYSDTGKVYYEMTLRKALSSEGLHQLEGQHYLATALLMFAFGCSYESQDVERVSIEVTRWLSIIRGTAVAEQEAKPTAPPTIPPATAQEPKKPSRRGKKSQSVPPATAAA